MTVFLKKLSEKYKDQVWEILRSADEEFIPPLSSRNDTTQKSLAGGGADAGGPVAYFEQMIRQAFILTVEEETVVGFLTYIPDHSLELGQEKIICDYISTIVVAPAFRNQGITREMYQTLLQKRSGKAIATRTWSTNYAHMHLLETLGFALVRTLKNDRGKGIDTVYYLRRHTGDA